MEIINGLAVSPGIAIGYAKVVRKEKLLIKRKTIQNHEIEDELLRFEKSVNHVVKDIDTLIKDLSHSKVNKEILTTHKMILHDPEFSIKITKLISNELYSLENAINEHFSSLVELFKNMDNEYFSLRSQDYEDVAERLLCHLLKQEKDYFENLDVNSILILESITPSGVTKAYEKKIRGFCTEKGSKNSHSSIIARSMNLPSVSGISKILSIIKEDQLIIIDGSKGLLIISPDEQTLKEYRELHKNEEDEKHKLQKLKNIESRTKNGKRILLMCNIEIPEELEQVLKYNSDGIGLFRTEFLFIDRIELPNENEQYEIYKKIAEKCAPKPVIIRTIDVGGDKLSEILNVVHEENPNLGCRGIRISLENIPVFKTQIRAILRANSKGNVKIMFPMISSVDEVIKAKEIIKICKNELEKDKIAFNPEIEIGAMIEIPSAALTSDFIAQECDFISIGTNDLIQYTLAVDRDNQTVSSYYQPNHPAVIQLIKTTILNAHKKGAKVAICGEMASEPEFIPILIGLGIDELSVSPGKILLIKNEILKCDLQESSKKVVTKYNLKD